MNNTKNNLRATDFDDYLKSELKDSKNKKLFNEYGRQLEIAYQILRLRKKRGMSQIELASAIGTKQSNIARIESGNQNFTINLLDKLAQALQAELKIDLS